MLISVIVDLAPQLELSEQKLSSETKQKHETLLNETRNWWSDGEQRKTVASCYGFLNETRFLHILSRDLKVNRNVCLVTRNLKLELLGFLQKFTKWMKPLPSLMSESTSTATSLQQIKLVFLSIHQSKQSSWLQKYNFGVDWHLNFKRGFD